MFELKCYNEYSSITTRYKKDEYEKMQEYIKFIEGNNPDMKIEWIWDSTC